MNGHILKRVINDLKVDHLLGLNDHLLFSMYIEHILVCYISSRMASLGTLPDLCFKVGYFMEFVMFP